MSDAFEVFKAQSLLLSDMPKEKVDAIFYHGRVFDGDDDKLPELTSELIKSGISDNAVVINSASGQPYEDRSKGGNLWLGRDYYVQTLTALGCNYVLAEPAPKTLEEGFTFHQVAEERKWKRAIVVAQPYQILRIMQVHLKVMEKRKYQMQIYGVAPRSVEVDTHKLKQIHGEWNRLLHEESDPKWKPYQRENLATIGEVTNYMLMWRDAI